MSQLRVHTIFFNIDHRTASGFSKYEVPDSVNFDIKHVSSNELFINIVLVLADLVIVILVVTFGRTSVSMILAIKHATTTSEALLVVKGHFVVVRVRRFLDEGFMDGKAV
jgi:hypothetical protein